MAARAEWRSGGVGRARGLLRAPGDLAGERFRQLRLSGPGRGQTREGARPIPGAQVPEVDPPAGLDLVKLNPRDLRLAGPPALMGQVLLGRVPDRGAPSDEQRAQHRSRRPLAPAPFSRHVQTRPKLDRAPTIAAPCSSGSAGSTPRACIDTHTKTRRPSRGSTSKPRLAIDLARRAAVRSPSPSNPTSCPCCP
jgi:hypothetical protein